MAYSNKNCFFTPEINADDVLKKTRIKTKTINLLEDPESYSLYIKRLQKKRDEVERERKINSSNYKRFFRYNWKKRL